MPPIMKPFTKLRLTATAALAATFTPAAQAADLALHCSGQKKSAIEDCSQDEMACFSRPTLSEESVFLRIDGGTGSVQIPATMFKVKGDGWVPIDEMDLSERSITGRLIFTSLTKARLKIDRYTGMIDLTFSPLLGHGFRFSGSCRPVELDKPKF